MASLWRVGFSHDPLVQVAVVSVLLVIFLGAIFIVAFPSTGKLLNLPEPVSAYLRFAYACFLKPHTGDNGNQQDALESFYAAQAAVYDSTRTLLLHGREDMLGLVAAQLKHKMQTGAIKRKPIWVDVGGGTGYNVEQMAAYLSVPDMFAAVYIVDLSPSLCKIARARFERLGWDNVHVICQDARTFQIPLSRPSSPSSIERATNHALAGDLIMAAERQTVNSTAELVTFSYALSMIPDFYPVIDSISTLLSPSGVIGVVDFYVQSEVDYRARNYTGGFIDRHCTWISRVFWRTWFEIDRVNLEPARRDYIEYKFGTILNSNCRNRLLGVRIPYYIWIGCAKESASSKAALHEVDAAATESPFITALEEQADQVNRAHLLDMRSKAYESAIVNLAASLPLPASWYQNHHWRIYFDDTLRKHTKFNNEYIYAFTWEDSRVDARLLKLNSEDVILAITSAGDNILSYALEKPKRIHAVDLNPSQNHLLELKVAAFTALGYTDVWSLFGAGQNSNFRSLLIEQLSPHMSSLAFQYWLQKGPSAFSGAGFYHTGRSRHALQLVGWIFRILGMTSQVERLCAAQTLNEQREIWYKSVRKVLLSRWLSRFVVGNEKWLWKVMGVPPTQRALIEHDYAKRAEKDRSSSGHAVWAYVVDTLDPVVASTLLATDNHYYLLCLLGHYTPQSHPDYLAPKAHTRLSAPGAFDGLRIHTDELNEVITRMTPNTLTVAVVMDSMDWFANDKNGPGTRMARRQIAALNRALKERGRVMLRSAGVEPWYLALFEEGGFKCKRVGERTPGSCIDRVNMYASAWICTKIACVSEDGVNARSRTDSTLMPLGIGESAIPL